jgi:hypothetical protein
MDRKWTGRLSVLLGQISFPFSDSMGAAFAQMTSSKIAGISKDQACAVVPAAGEAGRYSQPSVPAGTHELTAELSRSRRYQRAPITYCYTRRLCRI